MADWSESEVRATVRDYFEMLKAEMSGEHYVKAQHRRELLKVLEGRTEGAVERKYQNISAILEKHGQPYISGYKPLRQFQHLLEAVVLEDLEGSLSCLFPMKSHSWVIASPSLATKQMDKSAFLHHGTGVPKDLGFFFDFDPSMASKEIVLIHRGKKYRASLTPDAINTRTRLLWRTDFSQIIATSFPSFHARFSNGEQVERAPHLRFVKQAQGGIFDVSFVVPCEDESDIEQPLDQKPTQSRKEGTQKTYQSTRYERNPANREDAIRIHGNRCVVCDMDFGERYGTWGEGFIEIHHLNPFGAIGTEQDVDPKTDLVPVCPNCHRMMHRHGKILTIEAVKMLLKEQQEV